MSFSCHSYFLTYFTHWVLFIFLKVIFSSLITPFITPNLLYYEGQWITIPYVTPYPFSTYHILTYFPLVIPLFSMRKCNSLFNYSHGSDHLCCSYLCLFYSVSSFLRSDNKNAVLCSSFEKHHYLHNGILPSVLLTVPLLTVSPSLCAFHDSSWTPTDSYSCMTATHLNTTTKTTELLCNRSFTLHGSYLQIKKLKN